MRSIRNRGPEDAVYVVVGAEGGYVGRDGLLPEGDDEAAARGDDQREAESIRPKPSPAAVRPLV